MVVYVTNLIIAKDLMLMFIRRALAVSLSLLFVLSLFFPLKAVMAASLVAPAPAPPVIVSADSDKQPSAPPAVVPPAVPSADNKQPGASPSPVAPKVEAGLSREPKQAVSPEAEQKKPEAQQPSVAAPPVANEEKKNDSSAAKVPAQVKTAGEALSDDDLPSWREKLDEDDVEKMAGCEAIADHEHKQIIIRPKNGAKEGIIYVDAGILNSSPQNNYRWRLYRESMAMLAVIQATEGYTLKFEKRIYLFRALSYAANNYHHSNFLNPVPRDLSKYGNYILRRTTAEYTGISGGIEARPSTLASLGNIADVNTNFLCELGCFLVHTRIGTEDLNILAKKKYSASKMWLYAAFKDMKALSGYADFSNFRTGAGSIYEMSCMFEGAGTDDFVLNFSNKVLYYKGENDLFGTSLRAAFKGFKGVLIANNWNDSYNRRGRIKSAFRNNPAQLFGVKKEDAEKGYSLSSLVVTDNPELLKIRKNSKYYKKITLSYLDRKEELELPAIYDSRITPTGENDTNQPASADYMKIVKYQVDKAIQAKVQEMRQKYNIPANMQPFPTQAITFTPTSLFQNYKIYCPPAQMEAQPLEQTVYEGQEINKIKITVISQKEENLPTFAFDQAWQTELAKIGLKFTPAAPDPNNRKVLAAGTISGIIKDNSLQQELDSKGAKTYQITVTGKTTSGKEIKCEQTLKITVTRQIAVGNKPETSSTLSAYLILAGALSVILTGRNLAKK